MKLRRRGKIENEVLAHTLRRQFFLVQKQETVTVGKTQ